jgi:hypothetical protein
VADDRFERALSESDATHLITDAGAEIRDERDRKTLDDWALSIASQLDQILETSRSFGEAQGDIDVTYSDGDTKAASLKYERSGPVLRIVVTANAYLGAGDNFKPGILVGDDFELNSAVMNVDVTRTDINASASADLRYGLQPVGKFISVSEHQLLSLVEDLVRNAK